MNKIFLLSFLILLASCATIKQKKQSDKLQVIVQNLDCFDSYKLNEEEFPYLFQNFKNKEQKLVIGDDTLVVVYFSNRYTCFPRDRNEKVEYRFKPIDFDTIMGQRVPKSIKLYKYCYQ